MKKKAVSVLLAVAMVASMLAGCGGKDKEAETDGKTGEEYSTDIDMEEEPYTVAIQVVTLPGTESVAVEAREEAINAITVPAINCKVDIQEVWISEVANTTSMAVAGNEKMDLIHVATVQPISTMVGSGMLYDMDEGDLLEKRGGKLKELFGNLLKSGEVNGKQLAVPAKSLNAAGKGYVYNKEIADAAGVTIPENCTIDEFEKALYQVHEKNPEVFPFFNGNGERLGLEWIENYVSFGNSAAYGVIMDPGKEMKVENIYETDLFKDYCLRMWKWKQDGIQPGDPTDTTVGQDYFSAGKLFCMATPINEAQRVSWSQFTNSIGFAQTVNPEITNNGVVEYMWGIATNSERPDKAMDFLNFIYSNADVANILTYGIEGDNYEFAEGSEKVVVRNNTYDPKFFNGGDLSQMLIASPGGEDYIEKLQVTEDEAETSPIMGYMFDDTDFQTEASVLNSTILEYLPRLQCGMCESEEATLVLLDEFNEKLKAAGIESVVAGNQEQLDAYRAK